MNKISKKIVALVTMAAFVLTLVPAAAFADVNYDASSSISVNEDTQEITLDSNGSAVATVTVSLSETDANSNNNVWVWVTKNGVIYRDAKYENQGNRGDLYFAGSIDAGKFDATGSASTTITLNGEGEYVVHAGIVSDAVKPAQNTKDLLPITAVSGADTITVNAASSAVKSIEAENVAYPENPDGVTTIGTVIATVKGQVEGSDSITTPLKGKVVTVKAPAGFTAYDENGVITEATTNKDGQIEFSLIADKNVTKGVYTLKLTSEGVTKNVLITIGKTDDEAKTIEAVDTGKDLIKSNSTDLSSVAQVVFKNAAGQAVTIKDISSETDVRILTKPEKFNGKISVNTTQVENTKNYGLNATGLVAGDYKVRVALKNKDSVDISFTVKDFGTPVALQIEAVNSDVEKTSTMPMSTDAETKYGVKAVWVDENGVTDPATDVVIGLKAGVDSRVKLNNTPKVVIPQLIKDGSAADNTDLIGAVVTVTAVDANNGFTVEREFTIADPVNTNGIGLAFDSDNGAIEKSNTVTATVVDENGKTVKLDSAEVKAYVANKSVEDAYVSVVPGTYTNGEVKLSVYADQATTADIVVNVIDNNKIVYGGTLKYTFGDKDVNADTVVAMTIGSTDMIVDNAIVSGDAAPYIADGRTMVPIRALTEAFGAEVEFDNDARTVTIVDGDTTVVMTIDETTYTVNGEEKTMDVAPVIGSGDRTYVPIRFVAEALGYKVTPLYAADGTTASVVFQK